nr:plasmid mobilization relaxosome protein MobC [uncultured Ruminococcus sp.]
MDNSRNNIVKFRVDDVELEVLITKIKLAKCKSMSDYLRRISLGGRIVNVDTSEFTEMKKVMKNAEDNINQIAKLANSQKSIYIDDIEEIQRKVDEIWQQQAYILSLLRKLER